MQLLTMQGETQRITFKKGGATVGRLLDKWLSNSVIDVEEDTIKIYVAKWVFIWKAGVYIGYHKTK